MMMHDEKIRMSGVLRLFARAGYTICPLTLKRMVARGDFPDGVQVTDRLRLWNKSDVEKAIANLSQAANSTGAE